MAALYSMLRPHPVSSHNYPLRKVLCSCFPDAETSGLCKTGFQTSLALEKPVVFPLSFMLLSICSLGLKFSSEWPGHISPSWLAQEV